MRIILFTACALAPIAVLWAGWSLGKWTGERRRRQARLDRVMARVSRETGEG